MAAGIDFYNAMDCIPDEIKQGHSEWIEYTYEYRMREIYDAE